MGVRGDSVGEPVELIRWLGLQRIRIIYNFMDSSKKQDDFLERPQSKNRYNINRNFVSAIDACGSFNSYVNSGFRAMANSDGKLVRRFVSQHFDGNFFIS